MKLIPLSKSDEDFSKTDDLYRKLMASVLAIPLSMYHSNSTNKALAELNILSRKHLGYDWFKQDIK